MKHLLLLTSLAAIALSAADPPRVECVAGCSTGPKLVEPFGVAEDRRGNLYICEYKGQRVTRWSDGKSFTHDFKDPHGLVITRSGKMYVADTLNHRVVAFDLKTAAASVVAGTGRPGFSGDGGPAMAADFKGVFAVDIDRSGRMLYVTDLQNRRIRAVNLKSGIVRTIAGNGESGVPADGSPAVSSPLVDPRAAAVDSRGNVYILERRGNALRVVGRDGKIRTVVGPATANPPLKGPKHLFIERDNTVLIADEENHLVRRYDPRTNAVTTIAGTGEKGDALNPSDPLRTQLNRPHGVFVDSSGAILIADSYNMRILKLNPARAHH